MSVGYSAFTLKSSGLLDRLRTNVVIKSSVCAHPDNVRQWKALWDTGASHSCIDKRIAKALGLIPLGNKNISTANGVVTVNTHLVDITLPNELTMRNILVTSANLGEDIDLLIGMDIICRGDFSITNYEGKTTFSFRIPSMEKVDFCIEK